MKGEIASETVQNMVMSSENQSARCLVNHSLRCSQTSMYCISFTNYDFCATIKYIYDMDE